MESTTDSGLVIETRQSTPPGIEILGDPLPAQAPPSIIPSPWAGWPTEWATPAWSGQLALLTDTAWACLDSNTNILSTMPPYLVNAAPTLDADWLNNPNPDLYASWEEFAKQLFWDYQGVGEAFVLCTARYASGWPARFHVMPPWSITAEIDNGGRRRYTAGGTDVTGDTLHIRYKSQVGDAHGHGPLEVGSARMVAAAALARYASTLAQSGGVPHSVLVHPNRLTAAQALSLQQQWVSSRMSTMGLPAVLSGGVDFKQLSFDPEKMALVDLAQWNEARIAVLLSIPPICMALPSGGDPMTYLNASTMFDARWRSGLRPLAQQVMSALSGWALPRGTTVELNRDEYVRPEPLERAQAAKLWIEMGALTPEEVARRERFAPPEVLP